MKTTEIQTQENTILGRTDTGGISAFKGIPYARPPVGPLRWKAPVPAAPGTESIEAIAFGPTCIQPVDENEPGSMGTQSEDCLYLNIWCRDSGPKKKPVMVFIHGGGFIGGSSSDPVYDGGNFVRRSDVIFVTINYRVNVFGFMDLEEIGGAEYRDSRSLGLLDQIQALKWVKENISFFGGDPDNVTIFGESAGSASVCILMTVPQAQGLFQKVIAQSGCLNLLKKPAEARQIGRDFVKISGKSSIAEMLEADSREVAKWSEKIQEQYGYGAEIMFAPVADGYLVPEDPYGRIQEGFAKDIKLIIGSNADEYKYWTLYYDKLEEKVFDWIRENNRIANAAAIDLSKYDIKKLFDEFRKIKPELSDAENSYQFAHDFLFRIPNIKLAELQSRHNRVWMYFFTWASNLDGIGAAHAVELAFVFHNLHYENYTGADQPVSIADNMQSAWAAFAQKGDPNHAGIPFWDSYTEANRNTMVVNEVWAQQTDPGRAERVLLGKLY